MLILKELPEARLPPGAVAFGNFDGVHIGHQALLARLRAAAADLPGGATAISFWPHPLLLLRPEAAPAAVDTLAGRLSAMERCGVDRAVVLRTDADLLARPPSWFAELLFDRMAAKVLIAGRDARFGQGGRGDLSLLRNTASAMDAAVEAFDPVIYDQAPVSSSRVRALVSQGDVAGAAALLGRAFCLRGSVLHGDARGAGLGFPTANIEAPEQVQPAAGVYASRIRIDGSWHDSVTNAGFRPTFDASQWRIETHVIGWSGDLYGRDVAVALLELIRPEQRFAGLAELRAQIARDCDRSLHLLAERRATSCT